MKAPPAWATRFLHWFCNPELLEDLEGDLLEIYEHKMSNGQNRGAKWSYIWLVLRSFRPSAFKKRKGSKFLNGNIMVIKNLKIAGRFLWKDKFNTAMNLLGLTIGLSCFLSLGSYVKHELSFDQFHEKKDRLYRAWLREDYGDGKVFFNSITPLRFEQLFEDNFPEVEHAIQYTENNFQVEKEQDIVSEKVSLVSPEFFEVFDFDLALGDVSTVLSEKDFLLLSEKYALKYFGEDDPMGQVVRIEVGDRMRNFTVRGVFKNVSPTSSLQFDMLISNENNRDVFGGQDLSAWFSVATETYVLLKTGNDIRTVEAKMQDVVLSQMGDSSYGDDKMKRDQYNIGFQKLTDIHLDPTIPLGFAPVSNPQYVFILATVCLLVLVMACVNYTTITLGQSLQRSKEVGLRKALGAQKRQLIIQYLSESIIVTFLALFLASSINYLLTPIFNKLIGIELKPHLGLWELLTAFAIGIAAGLYPAFITAKFQVANILRSTNQSSGKLWIRKVLIVTQFVVTVFLISTTLIIRDQLQYVTNKDLGFNYKSKLSARLIADPQANRLSTLISSGLANGELLKSRLELYPEVSAVGMASHMPGTPGWANVAYTDQNDVFRRFRLLVVDSYFLDAFGIGMREGRQFEEGNGLDKRQSVILNPEAVSLFGLEDAVGKKLPGNEFGEHQIIGVTELFHFSSLHSNIEPLVIVQNIIPIAQGLSDGDFEDSVVPKLVFTYTGSDLKQAVEILQTEWDATFPNQQLDFQFLDQQIQNQYESELRMGKLITIAAVIAILISALGLLGLSMIVANSKEKEIGIRKVLGASATSIFGLIAKGFSIQIAIAIFLSIPFTYFLMERWLENFAYRSSIGFQVFVYSGFLSLVVAGIVISYHTLKAAFINPVQSLRNE